MKLALLDDTRLDLKTPRYRRYSRVCDLFYVGELQNN